jgi:hypothetical protein
MKITRKKIIQIIEEETRRQSGPPWSYAQIIKVPGNEADEDGIPQGLTIDFHDSGWEFGPGSKPPYRFRDKITDVPNDVLDRTRSPDTGQLEEGSKMKITRRQLKRIINEESYLLDSEDRVSEMHEFSGSRGGKKVISAGNKINSAAITISEVANNHTGKMRETLHRISEFVGKLGVSLAEINTLEEGTSVTDTLPTIAELKKLRKDLEMLEK